MERGNPESDANAGERFELPARYQVRSTLGRGAMGVVLEAHDAELDRAVAIKVIDPRRVSPDLHQRFLREMRMMAPLSHPNVIRLLDAGGSGETLYIVMELVRAESLAARLERSSMSEEQVVTILGGILDGLGHVHARGILHRDLKPANVLIAGGVPQLIDFGLARTDEGTILTATGAIVGTPRYLAPEIMTGEGFSVRSDLFAVGMIGMDALLAPRGLGGVAGIDSLNGYISFVLTGAYYRKAAELLAGFGRVGPALMRAIAPKPADRPESAIELQALLHGHRPASRALRAGSGVRKRPSEAPSGSVTPAGVAAGTGVRRGAMAVAIAAGLVVAVGLTWRATGTLDAPAPGPASSGSTSAASTGVDAPARVRELVENIARAQGSSAREAALESFITETARMDLASPVAVGEKSVHELVRAFAEACVEPLVELNRSQDKMFQEWRDKQGFGVGVGTLLGRQQFYADHERTGHGAEVAHARARALKSWEMGIRLSRAAWLLDLDLGSESLIAWMLSDVLSAGAALHPDGKAAVGVAIKRCFAGRPERWGKGLLLATDLRLRYRLDEQHAALGDTADAFLRCALAKRIDFRTHEGSFIALLRLILALCEAQRRARTTDGRLVERLARLVAARPRESRFAEPLLTSGVDDCLARTPSLPPASR